MARPSASGGVERVMRTYSLAQLRDGIAQLAKLADNVSGRAVVAVEDEPTSSRGTSSRPADAETRPMRTIHFDRAYDGSGFSFEGMCSLPHDLELDSRDARTGVAAVLAEQLVWPRGKVSIVVVGDALRQEGVLVAKVQIALTDEGLGHDRFSPNP